MKGGISSVIKGYLTTDLARKYNITLVSSHVDGTKIRKFFQALSGLIQTFKNLCVRRIDIVHIHGGDIVSVKRKFIYFKLVKLFNRKVIYHVHGGTILVEQYASLSPYWQKRIRYFFENSDLLICLSESWCTTLLSIAPGARIKVIPNSVKLPVPVNKYSNSRQPVEISFLGSIGERKGLFDLLEAVKRLDGEEFEYHLNIGGSGDLMRLESEITRLHLNNNVRYIGWISDSQRDRLLRETDIFVLPSYGEGMPMSILEAMSYAIPVISTHVGGIPELVIDGETGFLIKPGDIDSLANKLEILIRDSELRRNFGERGRQVIGNKFNLHNNIMKIDEIYVSLSTMDTDS